MLFSKFDAIYLDVDATLVNIAQGQFNENLIQILKQSGVREVYLLTRYSVQIEPSINDFTRLSVIAALEKQGISVKGVLTPLDIALNQTPGAIYEEGIRPLEEAIEALKKDRHFGALDVEEGEQRKAIIAQRFRNFKTAYKKRNKIEDYESIDETNLPLIEAVYKAHAEACELLQLNNIDLHEDTKNISKGQCRVAMLGNEGRAAFIDDSKREREAYQKLCPDDVVLSPPRSEGFQGNIYAPAAQFLLALYRQTVELREDEEISYEELEKIADAIQVQDPYNALALYLAIGALLEESNDELNQKIKPLAEQLALYKDEIANTLSNHLAGICPPNSIRRITQLSNEYAEEAEKTFYKALNENIHENVVSTLPSLFAAGIIGRIKRWWYGEPSSQAIEQVIHTLTGSVEKFNLYPKQCLKALSELRLNCHSAELDKGIRQLIDKIGTQLAPETSLRVMKELIKDDLKEHHYQTGLFGSTGVRMENRNVPQGVSELLNAADLPSFKQVAKIKLTESSFFRQADTRKLYEWVAEEPEVERAAPAV